MKQPQDVLYRFLEAWKSVDVDAYADCFADDFLSVHPFGRTNSRDDLRRELTSVGEHWRDLDYRIVDMVADGERIAVDYLMTMSGAGRGFEGPVELPGLILATVRDGRIVRYREEFDPRIVLAARSGNGERA